MNKLYIYTTLYISVKQDLAYDSSTGMLVGFTDIGNRDNPRADELATHALTIYVKSFCGKPGLKYPIAYFGSTSLTGSQLASILWESIALLEKHGLQVSSSFNIGSFALCSVSETDCNFNIFSLVFINLVRFRHYYALSIC